MGSKTMIFGDSYLPEARTIDAVRRETPYTFGKELDIHVPLLCLAAVKEPDTVRRLVDTAVTTADNYIRNTEFLMTLRIRLLEIAAK